MLGRYKHAELAVVGTAFFTEGGDWWSICLLENVRLLAEKVQSPSA